MQNQLINFTQVLGQKMAVDAITTAYRRDRLPHGLIFAGPVGVGKATTVRALAGLFLCEKPRQLAVCGKCDSCRVFDAGNHPDFHVIYRQLARIENEDRVAKLLSIEVVRQFLLAKAANKSVLGVGKVFMIEEAELLTPGAQNALLKTLEEPAGRTLIILLTDNPESLLPTIRSRCQLVRFAPLDERVVQEQLVNRGINTTIAMAAAKFAGGSLGLALRWIEDGVIDRAGQLSQMIEGIIAGECGNGLQEWFKSAADEFAEKQLARDERASKDQMTREGIVLYLKLASEQFRRQLAAKNDADAQERICAAIDGIVRAEEYLESNVNIALVLQQLTGGLQHALSSTRT